jgi:hydrogenase maturation protein HypF
MNSPAQPLRVATLLERRHLLVRGLVQGVGFRPHVYRTALRHQLTGFVCNGADGVIIEVEGSAIAGFLKDLCEYVPPLARIDSLVETAITVQGSRAFEIRATESHGPVNAAIPADKGLCADCLRELFDPADRRYLHPFIACCNCGPRFTMTRQLPYDRASTSMADFELCPACATEYAEPASRRFHAEPIACHHCGPRLSHSVGAAVAAIRSGKIVAMKGIGGFHLACDANNAEAVAALRKRKNRDARPFAVMLLNTASARQYALLDEGCEKAFTAPERPVLVLPQKPGQVLPQGALSPGLNSLGLMLPYTAIHYLLFHAMLDQPAGTRWLEDCNATALVMTSANISGDPLIIDNHAAREDLARMADLVLTHDRAICARADDSVLRIVKGRPLMLRRARGYTPGVIEMAEAGPAVLALGAQLKNSVTLTHGGRAYLSQHIGDLQSPATVAFQQQTVDKLCELLQRQPQRLACDWHPDYASTRLAENLSRTAGLPLLRVQHHHAHIAALLAVHQHQGPALGIALDGHGLGENGEAWGGELLRVDGAKFQRLGHLAALSAVGGDAAAREPWRMAAGLLHKLGRGAEIPARFADEALASALLGLLDRGNTDSTTAAGRLFDTAAALLGVSQRAAFEGEAPMRLEGLVGKLRPYPDAFSLEHGILDFTPLLSVLADCKDPVLGSEWLHGSLVEGVLAWIVDAAERSNLDTVALSGGCMLNHWLAAELPGRLRTVGLEPLLAEGIPPNDGSISLGQAWVAQRMEVTS